jgi:hypothetical protein
VGALHATGDAGVMVTSLNTLPPATVVPVPPVDGGVVVEDGARVEDVVLDEDAVEEVGAELEVVVEGGGGAVFLSLLHAASAMAAIAASAAATTGPGRGLVPAMKREATAIRLRILVRHVWFRRYRAEQRQGW